MGTRRRGAPASWAARLRVRAVSRGPLPVGSPGARPGASTESAAVSLSPKVRGAASGAGSGPARAPGLGAATAAPPGPPRRGQRAAELRGASWARPPLRGGKRPRGGRAFPLMSALRVALRVALARMGPDCQRWKRRGDRRRPAFSGVRGLREGKLCAQ